MSDEYEVQRRRVRERLEQEGAVDLPAEEHIIEYTEERDGCTGFVDLQSGVACITFDSAGPRPGSPHWPFDSAEAKAAAKRRADGCQ